MSAEGEALKLRVRALELTIEAAGPPVRERRGRITNATFSGGRYTLDISAAGLTVFGGCLLTPQWGATAPLPPILAVETSLITPTSLGLLAYLPPSPGGTDANWYGGPLAFAYLVWGT